MEFIFDELGNEARKPIKYIITEKSCWECISHSTSDNGYLRINRGSHNKMHRYIYELYHGQILENQVIMHTCDNPKCINPWHLKAGTQKDNVEDMYNKGRNKSGMKGKKHTKESINKMSKSNSINKQKIKDEDLFIIKELLIKGEINQTEIASKFNVSQNTISRIKTGKSVYSSFLNGGLKDWLKEGNN